MKTRLSIGALFLSVFSTCMANAANLTEVMQEALQSDPTYQQAIAQKFVNQEEMPIALASLLPSFGITGTPFYTRATTSGPSAPAPFKKTGYQINLTLTQTIFNFSQGFGLLEAKEVAKQAEATVNAALQDLMIRASKAYFKVLEDEETLRFILATKTAFAKQLDQVKQEFEVGLKTITDVYTAEASYQSSVAEYIAAENQLDNDKENLRAITGQLYPKLATLREDFPLISPQPNDIDAWVKTAIHQNWTVKANQFAAEAARQNIKQQFAGHLPSLNAQGTYNNNYARQHSPNTVLSPAGSERIRTTTVQLNLNIPVVQGGLIVAQTRQAQYSYQAANQALEKSLRDTMNLARQSFLGVQSGISKITADRKAVRSAISSLEGFEAGYRVGTQILLNVLDQQQKVVEAQKQYAIDRYAYVNNLLALKQAAGTLSFQDLDAINAWLENGNDEKETIKKKSIVIKHHAAKKHHKKKIKKHVIYKN